MRHARRLENALSASRNTPCAFRFCIALAEVFRTAIHQTHSKVRMSDAIEAAIEADCFIKTYGAQALAEVALEHLRMKKAGDTARARYLLDVMDEITISQRKVLS